MKLLRSKSKAARERIALLTDRRSAGYERALPIARRIVDSVRRGGDAALLRHRAKLDGISSQIPLQIPAAELEAAWNAASGEIK